jgi:anti-sigma factor RsiW
MKEITCVSGVDLLMDYVEGVLSADVRAALEGHVAGCRRCAAFVRSYGDTPRILREATEAPFPSDLEAALKAFLRVRTAAFKSS